MPDAIYSITGQIYLARLSQTMGRLGLFLPKCTTVFVESVQNRDTKLC
ncbi:Uncharacterised protein [Salmonella enterica subsp. arizonae]|nr:Uncharacterised protein [Salmonella enterica subsp. arizonae]